VYQVSQKAFIPLKIKSFTLENRSSGFITPCLLKLGSC
jgi:hypothetical protein